MRESSHCFRQITWERIRICSRICSHIRSLSTNQRLKNPLLHLLLHPLPRIRSCIRSHLSCDLSEPIRLGSGFLGADALGSGCSRERILTLAKLTDLPIHHKSMTDLPSICSREHLLLRASAPESIRSQEHPLPSIGSQELPRASAPESIRSREHPLPNPLI